MPTEYIVMTATCRGVGRYKRVAVCEVEQGVTPKLLATRAKGMVRIVVDYGPQRVGTTDKSSYAKALARANNYAKLRNAEHGRAVL